jgi:hypothetical protein
MIESASAGILIVTLLAVFSVRRNNRRQAQLYALSVALVWIAYLGHAITVIWASLVAAWPLPIPRLVAVILGTGLALLVLAIWQFRSMQRMSSLEVDTLITGGDYRWKGRKSTCSGGGKLGKYIGSEEGTLNRSRIMGGVNRTLFEDQ